MVDLACVCGVMLLATNPPGCPCPGKLPWGGDSDRMVLPSVNPKNARNFQKETEWKRVINAINSYLDFFRLKTSLCFDRLSIKGGIFC